MVSHAINIEIIDFSNEDLTISDNHVEKSKQVSSSVSCSSKLKKIDLEDTEDRSIKVRNISFKTDINELEKLFAKFGIINKVTFICDKYNGEFKG
jgi:RNA recognition motif-containing protein